MRSRITSTSRGANLITYDACIHHNSEGRLPTYGPPMRLDPVVTSGDYIETFTYQVQITADAGTLLTNLAEVTSTSTDPEVAEMWAMADVSVLETPPMWYLYLPAILRNY